jgi:hypothetical protein
MKQLFELSSLMVKISFEIACRNMVRKFEGWNVVYYAFKRGEAHISDNNHVYSGPHWWRNG